jgi:hypothetical protein
MKKGAGAIMKKRYEIPEMEIEKILFSDVLTTSPIGSGDGTDDPFED